MSREIYARQRFRNKTRCGKKLKKKVTFRGVADSGGLNLVEI